MKKDVWHLVFGDARIDVVLKKEKGKVVGFSLNLSVIREGERHDVVRWDTAHGFLHKHEFWRTKRAVKEERYEFTPLDVAFRHVYDDLKSNWKEYVKRWERWMKK